MSGRYSLNLPIDLKQDAEQMAAQQGVSLNQFILWSLAEKVASLKARVGDPNYPGISYRLDAEKQLIPMLGNTGLRVQTIAIAHHHWGESVAEIAAQYDVTEKQVCEALAFYAAHKWLVDALIDSNSEFEPV